MWVKVIIIRRSSQRWRQRNLNGRECSELETTAVEVALAHRTEERKEAEFFFRQQRPHGHKTEFSVFLFFFSHAVGEPAIPSGTLPLYIRALVQALMLTAGYTRGGMQGVLEGQQHKRYSSALCVFV